MNGQLLALQNHWGFSMEQWMYITAHSHLLALTCSSVILHLGPS